MTDKIKYSNITVSKKTYLDLQKLSKEFLPGATPLSISKTVDVLVNDKLLNDKLQKDNNSTKIGEKND